MSAVDEAKRPDGIVPVTPQAVRELCAEIVRLRTLLEAIRDTAYSPIKDDYIWMDDRTPLGQFIDRGLASNIPDVRC